MMPVRLQPAAAKLQVLRASGPDEDLWQALVDGLPSDQQDLHYLPQYARIYERTYGFRAALAVYGDGSNYVLQPYVERPLDALPFLSAAGTDERFVDIANAYGYGGPALRSAVDVDARTLLKDFMAGFGEHCRASHYASEFTSLHPRLGMASLLRECTPIAPVQQKDVVYVDLASEPGLLWRNLRKGHKSSIGRARRHGARVERVAPEGEALATFERLYRETMQRNGAQSRWYFPAGYFRYCFEELGDEGASLFVVRLDDGIAAASILLHAFDTAYYHFSGADERFYEYGVGTLLVFEMARWAADQGYRWLHLGGGVSTAEEDPLLRFKSGFSALRAPLHVYGRVHDEAVYRRLCEMKRQHEVACGQTDDSDYFPLYRR